MKRYGEKATREALTNGAIIRYNEHFTADPGYRVRMNGETLGYITQDLFLKLFHDSTIEVSRLDYSFTEYTMSAQAAEKHPFSVAACVAHIRSFHMELKQQDAKATHDDLKHSEELNGPCFNRNMWKAFYILFPDFVEEEQQPQEAPQPEPKYYRNCETQETTNSATEAMSWHRAGINVTVCQRLADDHVRIVRISGAPQEQPETEDAENRRYAHRVADDLEAHYYGHLKRCPSCDRIVERADWDDLDVFRCPHCRDVDDVDSWESLGVWDYLDDVLDVSYIVGSDRQTLESVRIYVTLGGPTVWIDTDTRAVELCWGGRSASWGLPSGLCDELDDWAQEMWNC